MDAEAADVRISIQRYAVEIGRLRQMQELAFGSQARSSKCHEDKIVFPLLVSCKDFVEEIIFAVHHGFGRMALRTARTMYESVVTARYLNLHPEKVDDFLSKFSTQWAKSMQNVPEEFRAGSMNDSLKQQVPKYAENKMVSMRDLNWSGAKTLDMAREAGQLADIHHLAFDYASAFVHPSAVLVISLMSKPTSPGVAFRVGDRSQNYQAKVALQVGHDLILNATDLRLKYVSSHQLQDTLDICKADFRAIWGYHAHI